MRPIVAVDFETHKIGPRPNEYPPKPVGLALYGDGVPKQYLAWGHPTENNCQKSAAKAKLKDLYRTHRVVFHNSKFDTEVAYEHFGLPIPSADNYEDTLFLAFLNDPRSLDLGLKAVAENVLGILPQERDKLKEWILKTFEEATDKTWGEFISQAPGQLVSQYAIGDVVRTYKLFKKLIKLISDGGMMDAYQREKRLMPVLLKMESRGIRIDQRRLEKDVVIWRNQASLLERYIIKRLGGQKAVSHLGGKKEFNIGSSKQLANALEQSGLVGQLPLTKKGHKSTKRDVLQGAITDKKLVEAIAKRTILLKYLSTYADKWLMSESGIVYPSINQVRNNETSEDRTTGARTGRLSYSDSWQAIPKPDRRPYPDLPNLRIYVLADDPKTQVINHRDYCFSDDTEVLTDEGWKLFKDLSRREKLAQWKDGQISFAHPQGYQVIKHNGQMIHIKGKKFVDLLVSPNHRCLYLNYKLEPRITTADAYPLKGAYQLHAGILNDGTDGCRPEYHELVLLCALQADAKVEKNVGRDCWRAVFSLKKRRKIERLITCLRGLHIEFKIKKIASKPGFMSIRIPQLPLTIIKYLYLHAKKTNCASAVKSFNLQPLLKLSLLSRQFFLQELGYWDGRIGNETGWSYGTTSEVCANVAQIIAAVSGFRSTMNSGQLRSKKIFYSVGFSRRTDKTLTNTFIRKSQQYNGYIYCVTMPWSTVVVRRNGRVMITGQSQQEFRILAHYEDGPLLARYQADPNIDMHDTATDMINELTGLGLDRRPVKDIGFGLIYGMGLDKTAKKTGQDVATTKMLRANYMKAIPGLPELQKEIKARCKAGEPIRTWGGRVYYVEEPKYVEKFNRMMEFDYKMLNVLVQGSAGDCTKEAMIRTDEAFSVLGDDVARMLISVHDEVNSGVDKASHKRAMKLQKEAMESIEFDVLMLTDGKWGANWGELKKYKD